MIKTKYYFLLLPLLLLSSCSLSDPLDIGGGTPSIPGVEPGSEVESEEESNEVNVILMAGQSNMEGNTKAFSSDGSQMYLKDYCISNNLNYETFVSGYSNVQISFLGRNRAGHINYSNRSNAINGQFVDVKIGQGLRENYYGPEIGIADYLSNNDSDSKKTFLIKYAAGGTGFRIDEYNWRSPSTGAPGSLYNEFIVFINNNLANLVNLGYQPVIKSLIWMQGEDDANNLDSANLYYSRLTSFVSDVFNTFASYAPEGNVNNMSFVDGLIYQGESSAWPFSKELNEVKKSIAASNPNYHYLDTTETGLNLKINGEGGDPYHYDVGSMLKLGKGFGEILLDEGII